jgi:hypothetical protein
MAKLVQFYASGASLYAVVRNGASLLPWRASASAFVAYVEGDWAHYAISLTEQGSSGLFSGDFSPTNQAGAHIVEFRKALTPGSPAVTDERVATGVIAMDASGEVTLASLVTRVECVEAVLFGTSERNGNVVTFRDRAGVDRVRITYTSIRGQRSTLEIL